MQPSTMAMASSASKIIEYKLVKKDDSLYHRKENNLLKTLQRYFKQKIRETKYYKLNHFEFYTNHIVGK